MLEIELNVQKCTELWFSNPHPMGKGDRGNFTECIMMKRTRNVQMFTQDFIFANPLLFIGLDGVNFHYSFH